MIPVPEDHQMSTILGALHPWIEAQVSNRLKSPKSKSDLIELALKVESTAAYRGQDSGTGIDNGGGGKGGKRVRSDIDSYKNSESGPATSRVRKDEPTIDTRPARDLSRVKCFNCGQLGHVSSSCTKPSKDPRMPVSGKV